MSFGKIWLILSLNMTLALSMTACKVETDIRDSFEPTSLPLTPFIVSSPTPTPDPGSDNNISPTQPPAPTATPFIYLIQSGDTLLAIAQRYNITLADLLAANPNIDPNFLIVGDEVNIPNSEGSLAAFPLPTPISIDLTDPSCYPTADGGLWCLVMAKNPQAQILENVTAQISLYTPAGEQINQQTAITPLNIVSVGEAIPLAVLFPGPIPKKFSAQAELITALPVEPESDRYLDISITIDKIEIAQTFGEAEGSVTIFGNGGTRPANQVWLLALAIGADGSPVGFRKWESNSQVAPGNSIPFHIPVYSLGPLIAEIRVFGEARP